jgi:prepilin-type N-terminal cleavage/methylation domain-containing protein/prepilin-type processing-associated H-X9-DG protein
MGRSGRRSAFTLIELLVVIGIISLLISMLTPSLSRARQQAKATVCLARLSEVMKGLTAYAGDYDFALPPMRYEVRRDSGIYHGWAEALYESLYQDRDYAMTENFPVQRNREGRFKLFMCHEAEPKESSSGHYRAYDVAWSRGSLDAVKARLPLIVDANPLVTLSEDLLRSDVPRERIAGLEGEAYIHERHYGGANFAFNDGHAERSTKLKEQLAEDWDLNPDTPNQ